MIRVGIVGGGHGGTAILNTLHGLEEVMIVGISDINIEAPGMILAQQLGVFHTKDIDELLSIPMELIIEVTGSPNVQRIIEEHNTHNARIVYSDAAELMMILVNHQQSLNHRLEEQIKEIKNISDITKISVEKMRDTIENTTELNNGLNEFALETMEQVKKTDQIIKLIDNITQQTNILGLNASIEAARAGEHGKGFTVVAKEIQNLANNSQVSTKKIGEILNRIKEEMFGVSEKIETLNCITEEQRKVGEDLESALYRLLDKI